MAGTARDVKLDRVRKLRLTYNQLSGLDEIVRRQYGTGVVDSILRMQEGDFNFGALRYFLNACLSYEKNMTPTKAGAIIERALANGVGYAEIVRECLLVLEDMGVLKVEEIDPSELGELDEEEDLAGGNLGEPTISEI